jgi:hypothetical protein
MATKTAAGPKDKRTWTAIDYLWRGALIAFTLFVIFATLITFVFYVQYARYARELAETVDRIHAAGGPLEADEIEAYYKVPDGMEDLTEEYMLALSTFLLRQSKPVTMSAEEQQLPYVGTNSPGKTSILAKDNNGLVGPDFDRRQLATDYLEPFQKNIRMLRGLSHRSGRVRYPVKMKDNIMALLPHVQAIRDASRHLQLDFDLKMLADDRELALADLLAMLKLGETLSEEPILVSLLVRIAVFGTFVTKTTEFIGNGQASEEELAALDAALADVDFHEGLQRSLNGERAMSYLALKTQDARMISGLAGNGGGGTNYIPPITNLKDMRPGDTARLLQLESDMLEAAEAEFPLVLEKMEQVDQEVKREVGEQKLPWNKNVLTAMLIPALSKVAEATGRGLAMQRALRAAIAVERQFAKTGERPKSLAELVPEYLPEVPVDPFGGGVLRMQMGENAYTIYSVGKDKVDNGGLIEDQQLDVGVRVQTRGE